MKSQTTNQIMYNSNQYKIDNVSKQQTSNQSMYNTAGSLMKQQTTNQTMCNSNEPNETSDNKSKLVQQQSAY